MPRSDTGGWGGDYAPPRVFACYACGAPNPFAGLCQPCASKHRQGLLGAAPGSAGTAPVVAAAQVEAPAPAAPAIVPAPSSDVAQAIAPRKRGRPRKVTTPAPALTPARTIDQEISALRERVETGDFDRGEALVALQSAAELTYALADRLARI